MFVQCTTLHLYTLRQHNISRDEISSFILFYSPRFMWTGMIWDLEWVFFRNSTWWTLISISFFCVQDEAENRIHNFWGCCKKRNWIEIPRIAWLIILQTLPSSSLKTSLWLWWLLNDCAIAMECVIVLSSCIRFCLWWKTSLCCCSKQVSFSSTS